MIYYKFAKLFKSSGLSYRALEKRIGIGYVTLNKIGRAKSQKDYDLTISTLNLICGYFKVKPEDVLVWKKK